MKTFSPICKLVSLFVYLCMITTNVSSGSSVHDYAVTDIEKLLIDSRAGSAAAQYKLGYLFEYGKGVEANDEMAAYWYSKSAEQNYVDAAYRLAVLYDNGWGVPLDDKKAFELFTTAAKTGHELSQHDLAFMYFEGAGTQRDLISAYKWLKVAMLEGSVLMEKHLNLVAQHMSDDEIQTANYLATHWVSMNRYPPR